MEAIAGLRLLDYAMHTAAFIAKCAQRKAGLLGGRSCLSIQRLADFRPTLGGMVIVDRPFPFPRLVRAGMPHSLKMLPAKLQGMISGVGNVM